MSAPEEFLMPTTERDRYAAYRAGFFWTGVLMTLACLALVFASNTQVGHRLEHTGFPLSWAFAGLAVLQFIAVEVCHLGSRSNGRKR
jgi:hypothetical protein